MSQSSLHLSSASAPAGNGPRPIIVELGNQQLPARMRLRSLGTALRMPARRGLGLRRVLMTPVAMLTRLLSR